MAGRGYNVSRFGKSGSLQTPDRSVGEEKERKKQKRAVSEDDTAKLSFMACGRSLSFSGGGVAHAQAMPMEGQAGQRSRNRAELPMTATGGQNLNSFSAGCSSVVSSGTSSQSVGGDAAGKPDGCVVDPDFDYDDAFWDSLDMAAIDALVEEALAANARRRAVESEMERRKGKAILTAGAASHRIQDDSAPGCTRFPGGPSCSFQSASSLPRDVEEPGPGNAIEPTAARSQPRGIVPMQAGGNGAASAAGDQNPGGVNLSSALHDIFFGAEGQEGNNRPGFPPAAFYAQGNAGANNIQRFRPPGRAVDPRIQRHPVVDPAQPRAMLRPPAGPGDPLSNANLERALPGPPLPNSQSRVPALACGQSPASFTAPRRK